MSTTPQQNKSKGKVVIAGAGPGDAELITLKAIRHLNKADIVLTDRLVNMDIIESHAPQAIVIPVGKQCRKQKSTPQTVINELMVHHASLGRYVVRLKGGDVSIFSNIMDELEVLVKNNIPYEIIPGITAALGTAASAGVPLTARGFSKGVRLLTYYNNKAIDEKEWENLATTEDTLVFYMSGETCFELVEKLMGSGSNKDTPVLLAEQATTPAERFLLSTLDDCRNDWKEHEFVSPSLLIIGKVASLYYQYAWHYTFQSGDIFFDELKGTVSLRQPEPSSSTAPDGDNI
jgi:uroporphyrin-III C-methyltransferase/precorrin-2 dehydrogenase/sirohydrochlorin ferrochelatase/uroporphyrin-III C-methyltransferase